jgi:hypothetical protein
MPLLATWAWLLLILLPLVLLERWIHRHLQGLWLLLLRDADMALVMYSLMMLPGVLLHEGSHWVAATLLGVRAGRFSVVPQRMPNGTLRLGYVETAHADPVREALIGAAPLIAGVAAIVFVGYSRLGVGSAGAALGRGDLLGTLAALQAMGDRPDFWLWVYLLFTVANSMLPSASDRRAWGPVLFGIAGLTGLLVYAGLGPALFDSLSGALQAAASTLAAGFTLTVALNLIIMPLLAVVEWMVMRLTGLKVNY